MLKHIFFILALSACAKNEVIHNRISQDPLRDSMIWKSSTPYWATDLDPKQVANEIIHFVSGGDQECISQANLNNGNMVISNSFQTSPHQPGEMPCSYWDGNWTYSVTGSELTLCPANNNCVVMK